MNKGLTFKINRVNKQDPTRTATLRRKFTSNMMGRFNRLALEIKQTIFDNDFFDLEKGQKQNKALAKKDGASRSIDKKVEIFIAWLNRQIDVIIFGNKDNPLFGDKTGKWMDIYTRAAYESGLKAGYVELKHEDYIEDDEPEPTLKGKSSRSKKYLAAILLLQLKTKEEMRGVTSAMVQQISRVIIDDISAGESPRTVTMDVINRLNKVGKTRAKEVTNTEIVRDHDFAKLDIWTEYDVETVGILAEWITAQDDKVCPFCAENEFSVYPINELYFILPAHPYCRCAPRLLPLTAGIPTQVDDII